HKKDIYHYDNLIHFPQSNDSKFQDKNFYIHDIFFLASFREKTLSLPIPHFFCHTGRELTS
ncbi:hypothetical protein, partial [Bacillus paranthracis]|uniref:hypothetical protein n=1 Tax=Bacillus paranthracis TaxID=2026186 RepID=UPI001E3109BE